MSAIVDRGCGAVGRRIGEYLDGELAPGEMVEAARHVARCPECASRAAFEAELVAALRARLRERAAPPGLRERVTASIGRGCREGGAA